MIPLAWICEAPNEDDHPKIQTNCKNCGEVYYFDYEGPDALGKDYFDQVVTECTKCGSRDFERVDLNLLDKTKLKFRKLIGMRK